MNDAVGPERDQSGIAIVGMAARLPGAAQVETFWQNVRDGVESIHFFSDEELLVSGVEPSWLSDPAYVKARGMLDGVGWFDAAFFGYSPREAEVMDPQQRLFLECVWEALEHAGYAPGTYDGQVGIYAGASMSTYLLSNLYFNHELIKSVGEFQTMIANDKDHLTTRISYKLNLKGPSVNVQTACSTALVAVHLACQSLLNGECDLALAGGVCISVPQAKGHFYREGGIHSPDGHCRAFDARAQGTVGGSGSGVVVLKRLDEALADGDRVYAVVKGSAINNDGALKVGYTAPSVEGQSAVIAEALAVAGVDPETVSYVEAHGTGTPLGDPIEVTALTDVFRAQTEKKNFCALGSVKTNLGHLDVAAGVAGLIKTVMALEHKQLPPSLHFEQPNPQIDFANSPFYVNAQLKEWRSNGAPRRAGVSSFGIGGTNAHVVLEEAPTVEASGESRVWQAVLLSAKTETALAQAATNLATHLKQHPDANLADVAYTLATGRAAFNHRQLVLCRDVDETVRALETRDPQRVFAYARREPRERSVVFMFPGQGAQYVNMARELYATEPVFRKQVDLCAELLAPHLGLDVRSVLFPAEGQTESAARRLNQTDMTQPALFVVEYALAKLWLAWGVRPKALIGHSLGEYVAACLAGVFSLADALKLVAARGRLTQQLPGGAMLSVALPEGEVRPWLGEELSIAAVNAPALCAVAGPVEAVDALEQRLNAQGVETRRLHVEHAFHSAMLDSIVAPFTAQVKSVALKPPDILYLSNVTGQWVTAEEATDPQYWGRHLRQTVRFADGLTELLKEPDRVLLEVGPGHTLSTLAKQCADPAAGVIALASLRSPRDDRSDVECLVGAVGKLWVAGGRVDWSKYFAGERRGRLPLPTYPFERRRYWVEPAEQAGLVVALPSQIVEAAAPLSLHPRPNLLTPYVAPGSEIERKIAGIWQELLGIESVGVHDNFFEAGGHSLMATQLLSRLRETFPIELPLNRLFEAATIAELATVIEEILIEKLEGLPDDEAERLLTAMS